MTLARLLSIAETKRCFPQARPIATPNKVIEGRPCLISPKGEVYHCGHTEHWETADSIVLTKYRDMHHDPEYFLEQGGWCKITSGAYVYGGSNFRPTQAQIDAISEVASAGDAWWKERLYEGLQRYE